MVEHKMLYPPWPWRSDPGDTFNVIATFARMAAGFEIGCQGVDDSELIADAGLIVRDSILILVMAMRRARRAGFELDLVSLIATAQAEVERWERDHGRPAEPA